MENENNNLKRDCYVLELSVQPGGARWAELHTYTLKENILSIFRDFVENNEMAVFFTVQCEATLKIWVVRNGEVDDDVNLVSYLRIQTEDNGEFDADDPDLYDLLEDTDTAADASKIRVDWTELTKDIPELNPENRFKPGEEMTLTDTGTGFNSYLDESIILKIGSYEVESVGDFTPNVELVTKDDYQ